MDILNKLKSNKIKNIQALQEFGEIEVLGMKEVYQVALQLATETKDKEAIQILKEKLNQVNEVLTLF